jgi:hypothetical protein
LVPVALALAAVTGTFRGQTSQKEKVLIHVVDGSVRRDSTIFFTSSCGRGRTVSGSFIMFGELDSANRYSSVDYHYTAAVKGGGQDRHTITVHFQIKAGRVTGSFENRGKVTRGKKVLERCNTGKVSFTATR